MSEDFTAVFLLLISRLNSRVLGTCFVWVLFYFIHWAVFYGAEGSLSWQMFHMNLRIMRPLLLLDLAFLKCYFQIEEIFYRREFLYSLLSSNQPRTKLASPLQSVASPLHFCLTEGLIPSQFLVCVIPQ